MLESNLPSLFEAIDDFISGVSTLAAGLLLKILIPLTAGFVFNHQGKIYSFLIYLISNAQVDSVTATGRAAKIWARLSVKGRVGCCC